MRPRSALTAALLVAAAFATPAGANHDPLIGNRSYTVVAKPCTGTFSLTESPGEQTATNPQPLTRLTATISMSCNGNPIYLDYHSTNIRIASTSTRLSPPATCYNSDYRDVYPMTSVFVSCHVTAPPSGSYTATYSMTLHPWVAPTGAEPDCRQDAGWDGLYKTCTGTLSTVVL